MKKLFLLFILLIATKVSAAPNVDANVDDRVNQIISHIKKEKDITVALEYIHWPTVHKNIPEGSLTSMGAKTPGEFKKKVEMLVTNPRTVITEQMGATLGQMPPEQKVIFEKMMTSQIGRAEEALKKEIAELSNAQYKLISSNVEGEAAKVLVEITKPNGSKRKELDLILVDNVWYLAGIDPNSSGI